MAMERSERECEEIKVEQKGKEDCLETGAGCMVSSVPTQEVAAQVAPLPGLRAREAG